MFFSLDFCESTNPPAAATNFLDDVQEPLDVDTVGVVVFDPGCFRFFDTEIPLPACGLAEKLEVPGMASFPDAVAFEPLVVTCVLRVLTPVILSLSAGGEAAT